MKTTFEFPVNEIMNCGSAREAQDVLLSRLGDIYSYANFYGSKEDAARHLGVEEDEMHEEPAQTEIIEDEMGLRIQVSVVEVFYPGEAAGEYHYVVYCSEWF